jgi:two-component system response regulator AtoC
LLEYDWPGNVRELANALERASVLATGGRIRRADLPPRVARGAAEPDAAGDMTLRDRTGAAEADHIRLALRRSGGNRRKAAELLGISVRSLFYKLKALGIEDE